MKKILIFAICCIMCSGAIRAAVRDGNVKNRGATTPVTQQRVSTTSRTNARTATRIPATNASVSQRAAATTRATTTKTTTTRPVDKTVSRNATPGVTARAATNATPVTETRTGAAYEQCKNAYFACMDQFCQLKNDDYRRCSCSNRVLELAQIRSVMQEAGDQLTVFNENLDTVGLTAAQATAMRNASEGENALTSDTSASKALLQAIMNSIRGDDATVGGKYSSLNSINLAFDTTNAFGTIDAGAAVATYNGQNLYSAVYPQCRSAVRADCNDASLQRAINAYLMAIEQDCNTVQTAIETKQKQMKSAIRESSAMLDLARVENRQKHNSDDITSCINNVESAILSEEVCGANYHKCLDNGEFIDISTGAPIAGVEKFYELEKLLTFADGVNAADQKLSKISTNRTFVKNFENRTKKFAQPALDKCTEQADTVWSEYLDKAMLAIYYAQRDKVSEIKQGCFDFVSSCYVNGDASLTAAMKELTGNSNIVLQPDKVTLSTEMCRDYIESCNYMFDGNIIREYVDNRKDTDTLTACRAVAKQCFDSFGGTGYQNFYYPYSGLFTTGRALDWFTLYEYTLDGDGKLQRKSDTPVSECAKQLQKIDSCRDPDILERAFGGFDVILASEGKLNNVPTYYLDTASQDKRYGTLASQPQNIQGTDGSEIKNAYLLDHHLARSTGVATEVYNQVVDILTTQCSNLQGRFIELKYIKYDTYNHENLCRSTFDTSSAYGPDSKTGNSENLQTLYGVANGEDMCPRDYSLGVDTQSWGACLCWENGGRRSKWGTSAKCLAAMPVTNGTDEAKCTKTNTIYSKDATERPTTWCLQSVVSKDNQVCPLGGRALSTGGCIKGDGTTKLKSLPDGLSY